MKWLKPITYTSLKYNYNLQPNCDAEGPIVRLVSTSHSHHAIPSDVAVNLSKFCVGVNVCRSILCQNDEGGEGGVYAI